MVCWQTSPFWISIFAFCILRERVFIVEIVAMIICFSAVIIIAWQRSNESSIESTSDDAGGEAAGADEESKAESRNNLLGLAFALSAGIFMGFLAVSTRALKGIPTAIILFWYCVGGILFTCLFLLVEGLMTGEPSRIGGYTGR
mmetsp:Transcript_28918/g.35757  ORF Transcript_28918/g.35757 Transcript_28918/m.35757 type:complete len:144 (-) Transcript_28918:282-713(-)